MLNSAFMCQNLIDATLCTIIIVHYYKGLYGTFFLEENNPYSASFLLQFM